MACLTLCQNATVFELTCHCSYILQHTLALMHSKGVLALLRAIGSDKLLTFFTLKWEMIYMRNPG